MHRFFLLGVRSSRGCGSHLLFLNSQPLNPSESLTDSSPKESYYNSNRQQEWNYSRNSQIKPKERFRYCTWANLLFWFIGPHMRTGGASQLFETGRLVRATRLGFVPLGLTWFGPGSVGRSLMTCIPFCFRLLGPFGLSLDSWAELNVPSVFWFVDLPAKLWPFFHDTFTFAKV